MREMCGKFSMLLLTTRLLVVVILVASAFGEDYVHDPLQYQSLTDRGSYNFGYDTGLTGAHSLRQERRDELGVIRGRYGYTDPNGKLRMVYYEAGPKGYRAWGDVGPDGFGEGEFPGVPPTSPDGKLTKQVKPVPSSFLRKDPQRLSRSTTVDPQPQPAPTPPPTNAIERSASPPSLPVNHAPSRYYFHAKTPAFQRPVIYVRRELDPALFSRRWGVPAGQLSQSSAGSRAPKKIVVFTNHISHDI